MLNQIFVNPKILQVFRTVRKRNSQTSCRSCKNLRQELMILRKRKQLMKTIASNQIIPH